MNFFDFDDPFQIFPSPSKKFDAVFAHLFHYTSDAAKLKVIRNDSISLRFSRVDKFLDKNEGLQILEPYYYACGSLYEDGVISREFYSFLMRVTEKSLLEGIFGAWVFCFSKNGKSEFSKRRYAPGDGWILSFNLSDLDDICLNFPDDFGTLDLFEVEYSFSKMVRTIEKTLKECYSIYRKETVNQDAFKKVMMDELLGWMREYSLAYKSSSYRDEEEIRLVCKFNPGFSEWNDQEKNVQIRASINGYEPAVHMTLGLERLMEATQDLNDGFTTKMNRMVFAGQAKRSKKS